MEKSKNRTDMLAAGRRKLQKYREKKGGGNLAKSSSSLAKPGIENEEEPSMPSQASLALAANFASAIQSDASSSGTDERQVLGFVLKQLPSHLDIQDAQGAVSPNLTSSVLRHDFVTSPSGVSPEVAGASSSSEVFHELGDLSLSCAISLTGLAEKQNDGAHGVGRGAIEGEISLAIQKPTKVQEDNESSSRDDPFQGSGSNLSFSEGMEKSTYQEQTLEWPASSQITHPVTENSHAVPIVFGIESERKKKEDWEQHMIEDKMEVITAPTIYLDLAEESADVDSNISHNSKEDTSLEKKVECRSSSQDNLVSYNMLHLEPGERASEGSIEHSLVDVLSPKDELHGKHPDEVVSDKKIIVNAHMDGFSPPQMYGTVDSSVVGQFVPDGLLMNGNSAIELESFKTHLYLSYIAKDIMQLHLFEQIHLNEYFHHQSSNEMHRLYDLVKDAQESKETVTKEHMQCKSEFQLLSSVKDEIENKCLSLKREVEKEHIICCNLKSELHNCQEGSLLLSEELVLCRGSLDALQKENSSLLESLVSESDAREKLVQEVEIISTEKMKLLAALMVETDATKMMAEERALLSSENMMLLSQLKEKEETLQVTLDRNVKLQDNLRELGSCFEQLIEDNIYLTYTLDLHKAKIKEIESWMSESSCYVHEGQFINEYLANCTLDMPQTFYEESNVDASSSTKLKSNSLLQEKGSLLQKVDGKDSDSSLLKVLLKQLQQSKNKLQILEKSIQGMHSHSLSLSKSSGIPTTAGVSKLIKAFESKSNHIDICANEVSLTFDKRLEDSYTISIEQITSLSNTLNWMELELGKVKIHVMDNQNNWEALKMFNMDCESQKHQSNSLQIAIDELDKKVVNFEHRINEMLKNINVIDQCFNEEVSGFLNGIELLKGEVDQNLFILKQERDILVGMILEAVKKLDASSGLTALETLDTRSHFMVSVDTAILLIEKLHSKLEVSSQKYNGLHDSYEEQNKSFIDIQRKYSFAIELFNRFYDNLVALINEAQKDVEDDALNATFDKVLELLPEKCEIIANYLWKLLNERGYLFSRNNELKLDLSIKNKNIEELTTQIKELEFQKTTSDRLESTLSIKRKEVEEIKRRCLLLANQFKGHDSCKDTYAHVRSYDIGVVSKEANDGVESCNSVLLQLEGLVAFHLHNYEEIVEEIMLSRKLLQDANMLTEESSNDCFVRLPTLLGQVAIPMVIKLHEKLKLLTVSNVEKGTEIQFLKEDLLKMEETLEASNHEVQLKASEVGQLEQKLSSLREKLSIAVAKGKGLIVQRDSLKQALMEKTVDLDRAIQELLQKESLLDELDAKLKSCSEIGRIEALESELLYIRNSATALRDSFLQKDSVLQRIEEVLEELDLPDNFNAKDILEKIELLSRFAISHPSLTVSDFEQKSTEVHAHLNAGEIAVFDTSKKYLQHGSSTDFDELKRKYEEVQGKFYDLAEHNDILEQSLWERSKLVQKWEEILGKMDFPSHMLAMEPEDKFELLVKEFSDVKQERDALQLKVDNLEISSDMLIVDVEESHKEISELTAQFVAVKTEKEFFFESLEKLRVEYFSLSEKAVHDEQDRENLLKELDNMQEKLISNAQLEHCNDMENNLQKLHDLVTSALTESDKADLFSGGTLTENLEESLIKLIDRYTTHFNKSSYNAPDKVVLFDESIMNDGKMVSEEALFDKESDITSMKLELDSAYSKLASVEEDRDSFFMKCELLRLEIDNLKMQIQMLNAEKNEDLKKFKSLMLELDAMIKQRDYLQEQLTQEEQKSACFKEKLNIAVRKGKGLVQQRDSLKNTVDGMSASLEQLKNDYSKQTESLISEKTLLMNQLAELELNLQDRNQNYSRLLNALNAVDLDGEDNESDPVQKLRVFSSIIVDVRSQAAAAELEASRSKQAAELLLAELNEVQERNDFFHDELVKMEASLAEYSTEKNDSILRLEHFMSVHSTERSRVANSLMDIMSGIDELRRSLLWSSRVLANVLSKNINFFSCVENLKELSFEGFCSPNRNGQPFSLSSNILSRNDPNDEEICRPIFGKAKYNMHQHLDETLLFEYFAFADQALHESLSHCHELREHISKHSEFMDNKMVYLSETFDGVKKKNSALKDTAESLDRVITHLESKLKEKDAKISPLCRNLTLLYEACRTSVLKSVWSKSQTMGNSQTLREDFRDLGVVLRLPSYSDLDEDTLHSINDSIQVMAESILSSVNGASYTIELVERTKMELEATVLALQRELQEKDIQMIKVSEELVSQIRNAEAIAKSYMSDLESARAEVSIIMEKVEVTEDNKKLLESRLNELQDVEASSKLLQEQINSSVEILNAKDQEIEALMQALDEQEAQVEDLVRNNEDIENLVQKKAMQLESLEASHIKTMSKLSVTVSKFDELHNLSENLLAEIEILQSQLQQQDSEISFLRQEVTRSTNHVLDLQRTSTKHSSEVRELFTWMNALVSRIGGPLLQLDDQESCTFGLCIDIMGKKIASAVTELEELRATIQLKDALLETERSRVQELLSKAEDIENSLHGKERIELSQVGRASEEQSNSNSLGTLEIEQMVQRNKVPCGPIATHARSGRKANYEHIAIAIGTENDGILEDEDDDKSHGFKSLTMSRLVPRAARPVVDKIDGIWVSAERLLMRQPTLRLAVLVYWIALHALLGSFV